MKERLNCNYVFLFLCVFLPGCELLCQAGTGSCGLSREQAEKLLNPKTYGEHWTKGGMTRGSWENDWISCGGMRDGQYAGYAPQGSTTQVILASREKEREKLSVCMQSKGYEYSVSN